MHNRSKSDKRSSTATARALRLLSCALLIAASAGCKIDFGDLGWGDYDPGPGGETGSSHGLASGVNIYDCTIVDVGSGKQGVWYAIYWQHDEEPWQPISPASVQVQPTPLNEFNTADCPPDPNGPSAFFLPFDQAGTWKVRVIEVSFGDPYGQPNQCDSSTWEAKNCTSAQWEERIYTQSPTAPIDTIQR